MELYSKLTSSIVVLGVVSAIVVVSLLTAVEIVAPPMYSTSLATVQNFSAQAFVVFDAKSGEVLHAYNEEEELPIASITKLLVAPAVLDSQEIWNEVQLTIGDVRTSGRAGSLLSGENFSVYELLFPLLLESSNDAGAALVRTVPDLVPRTNNLFSGDIQWRYAVVDATGLSKNNMATALGLKNFLVYLNTHHQHLLDITVLPYRLTGAHNWLNTSPFISDTRYRGGKHGYTPEAGHTALVQFKESFAYNEERVIGYAVLGSQDLIKDIALLREYVAYHVQYR